MSNKSTQFVITTLMGGHQEMVLDTIFDNLSDAIVAAVNKADWDMKPSRSSKKSISIGDGEYEGQVKRIWMYYGAKYYEKRIYVVYEYDIWKSENA